MEAEAITAMVCSQGESPTHHIKQMKLFNAIAAAGVCIGLASISQVNASEQTVTQQEYAECMAKNKSLSELSEAERQIAWEKALNWKPGDSYSKPCRLPGKKSVARTGDGSQLDEQWVTENACPPGTRNYRTKGLFGLGARDIGCMSPYEAEMLRAQQRRNTQQNIRDIQNSFRQPRMVHCSTNFIGSTAHTHCL